MSLWFPSLASSCPLSFLHTFADPSYLPSSFDPPVVKPPKKKLSNDHHLETSPLLLLASPLPPVDPLPHLLADDLAPLHPPPVLDPPPTFVLHLPPLNRRPPVDLNDRLRPLDEDDETLRPLLDDEGGTLRTRTRDRIRIRGAHRLGREGRAVGVGRGRRGGIEVLEGRGGCVACSLVESSNEMFKICF